MNGILLVDKPGGMTSHDVVSRVRRLAGTRRVGHAGTLDPMATGLLVLGIERGTKLLTYMVGADKSYEATIRLGIATVTDDAEGEITEAPGCTADATDVKVALAALTGRIEQVPSAVSAIKVDGRRSYARVRAGEQVELAARAVTVSRFEILDSTPVTVDLGPNPDAEAVACLDLSVVVDCSSGTYIRALARDLGRSLGSAGHLTALRRSRVGPFAVSDALALEALASPPELLGLGEAASRIMPRRLISAEEAGRLVHGQSLTPSGHPEGPVAAVGPDGRLIAVLVDQSTSARPQVVFADEQGLTSSGKCR